MRETKTKAARIAGKYRFAGLFNARVDRAGACPASMLPPEFDMGTVRKTGLSDRQFNL
jgi:hypothetical protein